VGRKDARIRVAVPAKDTDQSREDKEGILSIVDEAFGQSKPKPRKPAPGPRQPKETDPQGAPGNKPEFDDEDTGGMPGRPPDLKSRPDRNRRRSLFPRPPLTWALKRSKKWQT